MKTQILFFSFLFFSFSLFAQDELEHLDLDRSHFQLSFITPPLSTNGTNFYRTVNDYSLNVFLGISAGTRVFEAAGFSNINLYYTKGLQAAGFANISGILPSDYNSNGIMAAGFANINGNAYHGIMASGFANVSDKFKGIQATGFANMNRKTEAAVQAAGFANITVEADSIIQAAGFANIALKGETKAQAAGFMNIADEVSNVQAAGFANLAKDVTGVQAAGFMNIARNVKGVQVSGFINVCDSLDGVALSFINIVLKNGYRSFELSSSDWSPIQVTYKMGTKKLYNIYSYSNLSKNWDTHAVGFGLGHMVKLAPKTQLQLELINHSAFHYVKRRNYTSFGYSSIDNVLQFKPSIKQEIGKRICLNVGPTLNYNNMHKNFRSSVYYVSPSDIVPEMNNIIQPFWKKNSDTEQNNSRLWVGFSAGISIN